MINLFVKVGNTNSLPDPLKLNYYSILDTIFFSFLTKDCLQYTSTKTWQVKKKYISRSTNFQWAECFHISRNFSLFVYLFFLSICSPVHHLFHFVCASIVWSLLSPISYFLFPSLLPPTKKKTLTLTLILVQIYLEIFLDDPRYLLSLLLAQFLFHEFIHRGVVVVCQIYWLYLIG